MAGRGSSPGTPRIHGEQAWRAGSPDFPSLRSLPRCPVSEPTWCRRSEAGDSAGSGPSHGNPNSAPSHGLAFVSPEDSSGSSRDQERSNSSSKEDLEYALRMRDDWRQRHGLEPHKSAASTSMAGGARRLTMIPEAIRDAVDRVDPSIRHGSHQRGAQGIDRPLSAWERKMENQRLADEIKKSLFSSSQNFEEFDELEETCKQLEDSLSRIPSNSGMGFPPIGAQKEKVETVREEFGRNGPKPRWANGPSVDSMFNHSRRPDIRGWLWISKQSALEGIGFPARVSEVRRFGERARKVRRIGPPPPLITPFAQVVAEMARRNDHTHRERYRDQDTWMEEDDLLEEDLRYKIQRGFNNRAGGGRDPRPDERQEWRDNRYMPRGDFHSDVRRPARGGYSHPRNMDSNYRGFFPKGENRPGNYAAGSSRGPVYKEKERRPDNQEIPKEKVAKNPSIAPKLTASTKCFRCTELGHHQLECTNDPVCYKCKKAGHMAVECASIHHKKLKMYGFGITGQGFYSIEIPEAKEMGVSNKALIYVLKGEASACKIEKELKNLINSNWEFQVAQRETNVFTAVFPDKASLDTFSKLPGVDLPLYQLSIKISQALVDPEASAVLQSTWIKIYGIPGFAKEEDIVKEITSIVAEPIKVDEFSLIKDEPVRVRVNCRNPSLLTGYVEVFFNGVGYELRFVAEGSQDKGKGGGGSGPGKPDDKNDKRRRDEEDDEFDRDMFRGQDRQLKAFKSIQKDNDASQGDSQEDCMEENLVRDGSPTDLLHPQTNFNLPLCAVHPTLGQMVIPRDCSSLPDEKRNEKADFTSEEEMQVLEDSQISIVTSQEDVNVEAQVGFSSEKARVEENFNKTSVPKGKILVHNGEGTYFMDAEKWPNLELNDQGGSTQGELEDRLANESLMDNISLQSLEEVTEEEKEQEWEIPNSKKQARKGRRKRGFSVATRSSSRIPRDGIPILKKATLRAQEKDLALEEVEATTEGEGSRQAGRSCG
ncbi:unnamed protein product [Urochloa decumbens]|uniref:CCHC-type domain-containing protein n=1 Tax=Urochloa decumbens TaxID=240449 RepID=A0ABC8XTU7_9POAL